MSLTNAKQCLGARIDKTSHEGSYDTKRGDHNGDRGRFGEVGETKKEKYGNKGEK